MSRASFPWNVLKVDSSADLSAIRRAYADRLRAMNPDDDPAAFARLRQARDRALALAKSRVARQEEDARRAQHGEAPVTDAELNRTDNDFDDDWHDDDPGHHDSGATYQPAAVALPTYDAGVANATPVAAPALAGFADADDIVSTPPPAADGDFTPALITYGHDLRPDERTVGAPPFTGRPPLAPPALTNHAAADTINAAPTLDPAGAAAVEARYALDDLIASEQPLDTAEAQALLATVLADPALDRVSERMGVENWLANAVARTLPRSIPLVRPLADYFGWREEAKTIQQSGAIALLADHALAQDFRERIERADNKGYQAWRALTTPGPVAWYARRPPYLTELMQVIRERHPMLEREYDPQRFDHWVNKSGGTGFGDRGLWIILAIVFVFTILGGGIFGEANPPGPETDQEQVQRVQLEEFDDPLRRRNTIDDVLREVGGPDLHISAMEAHDSALIRQMDERLLGAKGRLARLEQAEPLLAQILIQRIRGGLEDVRQADLVAYRSAQAMLAEARLVRDGSVAACYDVIGGTPRNLPDLPTEQREAWQEGQRRMLLGSRALAADNPVAQTFNLLATTWADAARRADMSEREFFASFRGDRGDTAYCRTYVALLRTALARPGDPDRLDVLRRL